MMKRATVWSIFLICIINVVVMFYFHEPWRDEAQIWLVARDNNLFGLIAEFRQQVHLPVWPLSAFVLAQLGLPFASLRILHAAIVMACFSFIAFKLKVPVFLKVVLMLGTPLLAELSTVTRPYALGVLLLLILTICYEQRFASRKYLSMIGIFLLINTNIFALAAALALLSGEIFSALKRRKNRLPYYLGAVLGLIFLGVTVGANFFAAHNKFVALITQRHWQADFLSGVNLSGLTQAFYLICQKLVPVIPGQISVILILILLLGIIFLAANKTKRWQAIYLLSVGMLGFTLVAWVSNHVLDFRHVAIIPFYFLLVWLITGRVVPKKLGFRLVMILVLGLWLIFNFWSNFNYLLKDIKQVASPQQRVAQFLRQHGYDETDILILENDAINNHVAKAYLQKVKFFRNVVNDRILDWSYGVVMFDEWTDLHFSQNRPGRDEEIIDFARQQAQLHKDEYRAILLIYDNYAKFNEGGQSVNLKLLPYQCLNCEELIAAEDVIFPEETALIYLLAQDGKLFF